jgi:2-keto-4-pentenoate hydratase/2-oxohepta-3-ene-1,7-dioic acid hydratase in catechol pathway
MDTYGVALSDTSIVDLTLSGGNDIADNLLELIESGESGLELAAAALENSEDAVIVGTEEIEWLPPIRQPGKICGIAMNNSASNERKISAPEHPAFFLKPASCLIAHQRPIEIRSYYGSVHPEPELAVVIGKTARDVDADEAAEYIFGYTIFDDITGNGMRSEDLFQYYALYASDTDPDQLERREQHLSYAGRYKGTDCFGAMGPWLVTRDEILDPDDLGVLCKVGGEIVAADSTRYYNYKVVEIISFISQFQTLHAGDVISCGTAFKASAGRKSIHHANLQVVDGPVEVTIDGLGTLKNPVVRMQAEIGNWRLT